MGRLQASHSEADNIRKIVLLPDDMSHVFFKLDFGLTRFPFLPILVEFRFDFVERAFDIWSIGSIWYSVITARLSARIPNPIQTKGYPVVR